MLQPKRNMFQNPIQLQLSISGEAKKKRKTRRERWW